MAHRIPRNAIVTGAARGIGQATVAALARAGMRVGCLDIDGHAAEKTSAALRSDGLLVEPIVADVSDRQSVIDGFGRFLGDEPLEALVNNAIYLRFQTLPEITEEVIERTFAVGMKGAIWCVQTGLPALEKAARANANASIVNVSSGAAFQGTTGFGAYAGLKAGLTGLTRQLAVELGPRGIRANSVAPGPIPTESALADPGKPDDWAMSALKRTPLGRMGAPEEVASVIAFLASGASSWVNGAVISVDGGKSVAAHDLR